MTKGYENTGMVAARGRRNSIKALMEKEWQRAIGGEEVEDFFRLILGDSGWVGDRRGGTVSKSRRKKIKRIEEKKGGGFFHY